MNNPLEQTTVRHSAAAPPYVNNNNYFTLTYYCIVLYLRGVLMHLQRIKKKKTRNSEKSWVRV